MSGLSYSTVCMYVAFQGSWPCTIIICEMSRIRLTCYVTCPQMGLEVCQLLEEEGIVALNRISEWLGFCVI